MRPGRLILGTHMDSGQMYCVYWIQAAAAYLSLYFFIFLSLQFSNIKIFVTLFSGTVRPRRLKLGTHMDSGQMYRVYRNQAGALIHPFISSVFFLANFQALKIFVLFSGTVRPIKLYLYIGSMHQAATSYLSLISLFFFLSNVQKLKIFITLFSYKFVFLL